MKKLMKRVVVVLPLIAAVVAPSVVPNVVRADTQQVGSMWCWAACVQEITGVSQAQVVTMVYGAPVDRPGNHMQVAAVCNRFGYQTTIVMRPASPQELAGTLRSGWQICASINPGGGMVGHMVVFKGLTADGQVFVMDPALGRTIMVPLQVVYQQMRWNGSVCVRGGGMGGGSGGGAPGWGAPGGWGRPF